MEVLLPHYWFMRVLSGSYCFFGLERGFFPGNLELQQTFRKCLLGFVMIWFFTWFFCCLGSCLEKLTVHALALNRCFFILFGGVDQLFPRWRWLMMIFSLYLLMLFLELLYASLFAVRPGTMPLFERTSMRVQKTMENDQQSTGIRMMQGCAKNRLRISSTELLDEKNKLYDAIWLENVENSKRRSRCTVQKKKLMTLEP